MKNNKKGFSLVECIVAIAVIAIITSSALGVYASARSTATREWERFMASTVADDSVSAFQSADNLLDFEGLKPDGVTTVGDAATGGKTQTANPIPFQTIRAYESGTVQFFNSTFGLDSTPENPIATFNYTDINRYTNDVHNRADSLDKLTSVYESNRRTKPSPGGYAFTNPNSTDNNKNVFLTYTDTSFKMNINYFTNGLGWTGSVDKTYDSENEYTPFEKYLWDNGYFLGIPNNLDAKDTICDTGYATSSDTFSCEMYFYLYKLEDGKLIIDRNPNNSKQYHTICIKFQRKYIKNIGNEEISSNKLRITGVYEGYVTKEGYQNDIKSIQSPTYSKKFVGKNGETFENFDWGGFPMFAYFCSNQTSHCVSPNYENITITTIPGDTTLLYTDYTLKDTSLKIDYALYKTDDTMLCSSTAGYQSDKPLFRYTGGDALNEIKNKIGLSSKTGTQNGYDQYQKITVTVSTLQKGYYYYLPSGSSVGCFVRVLYSGYASGERRIQAWILKKAVINDLKSKQPNAIDNLLPEKADFSYRKG